jgi:plastocyanin
MGSFRLGLAGAALALAGFVGGSSPAGIEAAALPGKVQIADRGVAGCLSMYCYLPPLLNVQRGATVVWVNTSLATHTVTRCTLAACGVSGGTGKGRLANSGPLLTGQPYKATISSPGTYVYYCTIHGYSVLHGELNVS